MWCPHRPKKQAQHPVNENSASICGWLPTCLHISQQQGGQGAEELLRKLAQTPDDDDTVASSTNCTISYTSHYVEVPRQSARGKIRRQSPLVISSPPTPPLCAIPYSCEA